MPDQTFAQQLNTFDPSILQKYGGAALMGFLPGAPAGSSPQQMQSYLGSQQWNTPHLGFGGQWERNFMGPQGAGGGGQPGMPQGGGGGGGRHRGMQQAGMQGGLSPFLQQLLQHVVQQRQRGMQGWGQGNMPNQPSGGGGMTNLQPAGTNYGPQPQGQLGSSSGMAPTGQTPWGAGSWQMGQAGGMQPGGWLSALLPFLSGGGMGGLMQQPGRAFAGGTPNFNEHLGGQQRGY